MSRLQEKIQMTIMKVRRAAQVTLPVDVRKALNVKEGDYLEAELVSGGVLLKPVSLVERKRAWAGIVDAVTQVEDTEPQAGEDVTAEEEAIAKEVAVARKKHA